jgi:hypothetical protein
VFYHSLSVISGITEFFSSRPGSIAPQVWSIALLWSVYSGIVYLTTVAFDLRMGKTINEVELGKENIPAEQLMWMNTPDTCPACGHAIEARSTACPDCGLRL